MQRSKDNYEVTPQIQRKDAKTQRRKGEKKSFAKKDLFLLRQRKSDYSNSQIQKFFSPLCVSASLRLCVEFVALLRNYLCSSAPAFSLLLCVSAPLRLCVEFVALRRNYLLRSNV